MTLTVVVDSKVVAKNDEGKYILTDAGKRELERIRFVRVAEEEDDLGIIANTRTAIALGRCYDFFFDLRYLLSRTTKADAEDKRAANDKTNIIRNLLLKYNPSLKKEEL